MKNTTEVYEKKIRTILEKRLEENCNYNVEIKGVKTWLCCECYCGELDLGTFSTLINKVENIADSIMRKEQTMRTIPEVVKDIKDILNNAERIQDGETLVDIDEHVNEILAINSQNERIPVSSGILPLERREVDVTIMEYTTHKEIRCEKTGTSFTVGQEVTIKFKSGGGCGGCRITKITDTGFHYCQGTGRSKSVQYKDIAEIY